MTAPVGGWNMPSVIWLILGLLVASLLAGGTFVLFREQPPPGAAFDKLSAAEKEKKFKEIVDDLQEDPLNTKEGAARASGPPPDSPVKETHSPTHPTAAGPK